VNPLPLPVNRPFDPGRASGLVSEVTPARKTQDATSQNGPAGRSPAKQALDVTEREMLMGRYQENPGYANQQLFSGHNAQRAVSAYNEVAFRDERDQLKTMLGISEYA